MSLIERASSAGARAKPGGQDRPDADGDERRSLIEEGVRRLEAGDEAPFSCKSAQRAETPADRRVQIDFNQLRASGFFTPTRKRTRLGMELRAIKRRLLGKIGYFELGRRPSSAGGGEAAAVLFTSSRPGEGKTFLSVNTALSLAFEDDTPVLLVDADLSRPKVAETLGLRPSRGLADLARDAHLRPEDVVLKAEGAPLYILSSGLRGEDPSDLFGSETARRAIRKLRSVYADCIVVFDAPPVLATTESIFLAGLVDEILFVVQANETRSPMLETAIEEIASYRDKINFVLNFCAINREASHYGSYYEYASAAGSRWSETPDADDGA